MGEVILSTEDAGKPLDGRSTARCMGKGLLPLSKNPTPCSGHFGPPALTGQAYNCKRD